MGMQTLVTISMMAVIAAAPGIVMPGNCEISGMPVSYSAQVALLKMLYSNSTKHEKRGRVVKWLAKNY